MLLLLHESNSWISLWVNVAKSRHPQLEPIRPSFESCQEKGCYTSTWQNGSFTGHWTFSMAPQQLLLTEVTSRRAQALEAPTSPTDSPESLKTAHMAKSYSPELPRSWGLNVTLSIDQGTCPFKSPKGHCVSWWKIMFPRGKSTILWAYKLCHLQLK